MADTDKKIGYVDYPGGDILPPSKSGDPYGPALATGGTLTDPDGRPIYYDNPPASDPIILGGLAALAVITLTLAYRRLPAVLAWLRR